MTLVIRPGVVEDTDQVVKISNEPKIISMLGAWVSRDQVEERYMKGNKFQPFNIVAELDGEIVGMSSSKLNQKHYAEFTQVAVLEKYRRQHIGTAMYTYHVVHNMLMGCLFGRDQTVMFNEGMEEGFLPYMGFYHIARKRNIARDFSSLNWWILNFEVSHLERMMVSLPDDTRFEGLIEKRLLERYLDNFETVRDRLLERERTEDASRIIENRQFASVGVLKLVPATA